MKTVDLMEQKKITAIAVDLDGVMFNFEKKALEVAGQLPDKAPADQQKQLKRDFWKAIERHMNSGKPFFADMELLPDAKELWEFLTSLDVEVFICSATGHLKGAGDEKRAAVRKHLGDEYANSAKLVRDGKDKARYATASTILIDDRMKVITPWVDAGGIGILHTDAKSTIEKLKEYL